MKMDESITVDEWKQHFMNLLEGTESSRGEDRWMKVEGGETGEIIKGDTEEAIRKPKKKQSAVVNGIRKEA